MAYDKKSFVTSKAKLPSQICQKAVAAYLKSIFHSLEVVDRISETQLQVGENSD